MPASFPPSLPRKAPVTIDPRKVAAAIVGVVALIIVFTSYYTVDADSEGVVQRFGRYQNTVEPGLHFKIPLGVDNVTIVPVRRQLKLEFGFATAGASDGYQYSNSRDQDEARSMVTGDLNAAQVEWVVQYGVHDARAKLFNLRDPVGTMRDISESVMREVVGDRTVDEVLTYGRQEIENDAMTKLSAAVDKLGMGLRVQQVQLKNVHPPAPVQRSFDEVNRAQQEREQTINMANGEYNKVVPLARGEADQKISEAQGYAVKRVNEAEGDVARFKALLEQYQKAPDVTRQRLYLETMAEVIPALGSKIILDDSAKQFLPLMNLQQTQYAAPATR